MNREDIIRMAREAGWEMDNSCVLSPQVLWYIYQEQLERFATLVASAERERLTDAAIQAAEKAVDVAIALEREACANICETLELPEWPDKVRQPLAQAIRARGEASIRGQA